jgi:hypothetical protein
MPTNREDDVYIKSGETLRIDVTVRDPSGEEMILIGANAKFGILTNATTVQVSNCTISGSVVTAVMSEAETADLDGNYKYEIVLETADGERKSLAYGIVVATPSLIGEIYT